MAINHPTRTTETDQITSQLSLQMYSWPSRFSSHHKFSIETVLRFGIKNCNNLKVHFCADEFHTFIFLTLWSAVTNVHFICFANGLLWKEAPSGLFHISYWTYIRFRFFRIASRPVWQSFVDLSLCVADIRNLPEMNYQRAHVIEL